VVGEQEGALEDILAALCGAQHIVLQYIMPHKSGFVPPPMTQHVAYVSCQKQASKEEKDDLDGQLPLAGPGIHGCHALPSQCIQPADHVSEVEGLVWGGEAQLHQVWVLQVPSTAAQVVHHGHWHAALAWAATARCLCSFIRRGHGSFPALPFTRRSKQSTRLQTRRWQVLTRWNRRVLASCSGEEWQ